MGHSVRTNHSSGRPRRVKTAQGRVKLTHQSSDRTSANFVLKKHNQPTFHETTATNSHSIRTLNSIPEAAILSLLVHMLSCAWWERPVHFCLVPCSECCVNFELSNHGPVSRGLPVNGSNLHLKTTTIFIWLDLINSVWKWLWVLSNIGTRESYLLVCYLTHLNSG